MLCVGKKISKKEKEDWKEFVKTGIFLGILFILGFVFKNGIEPVSIPPWDILIMFAISIIYALVFYYLSVLAIIYITEKKKINNIWVGGTVLFYVSVFVLAIGYSDFSVLAGILSPVMALTFAPMLYALFIQFIDEIFYDSRIIFYIIYAITAFIPFLLITLHFYKNKLTNLIREILIIIMLFVILLGFHSCVSGI